ncbi:hypothetical protein [Ralstonia phage RP13]|nr:hypothetical protein [Ralstonia phage RP13]
MDYVSEYLDVDIGNDGSLVFNSDSFLNKVNNILSTPYGTMPFLRKFGNNIEYYLFRPFTYANATLIGIEVENSIKRQYIDATVVVEIGDLDFSGRVYPFSLTISHPKLLEPLSINKSYQSHV